MTQRLPTEITLQIPTSYLPDAPAPEAKEGGQAQGGGESQIRLEHQMRSALEERDVFTDAARQIASRAVRAGLDVAALLALLEAHVCRAEQEQARDPLSVAVWRLQHRPLRLPQRHGRAATLALEARTFLAAPLAEEAPDRQEEESTTDAGPGMQPSGQAGVAQQAWQRVLDDLRGQMTRATFELWFKDARLARVEGEVWVVSVPSASAIGWLEGRLKRVIRRAMVGQGLDADVRFEVAGGESDMTPVRCGA